MKTSFKTIALALALISTGAFAKTNENSPESTTFSTGVYTTSEGNLHVNVKKTASASASVVILNPQGTPLVREGIARKETDASFLFHLNDLKDGKYQLVVASKGKKEIKEFTVQSSKTITERKLTLD